MIRLIRYEYFKLFCKRSIVALLLVFSLIDAAKIYSEYRSYSFLADGSAPKSWHTVYWHLYENYNGEITESKIQSLLSVYEPLAQATSDMTASTRTDNPDTMTGNQYSDRNLLEKYYVNPMRYFYNYERAAHKAAQKAKENAALYSERGNTYESRKNAMIYYLYADRAIHTFAYREMYNYYLNYDFSTVLILLLCLYGIVGTFTCEKETCMDMILLSSPNGGRKVTAVKIAAVSLFLFSISLWFSVLDYCSFALSYGTIEGWSLPVYAIESFSTSAVNLSLLQYSVLSMLIKAIGVWTIGLLLLLISMFWRNTLIPFTLGVGICLTLLLVGTAFAHSSNVWAKCVNPYSLLINRVLIGETEFVRIADYPVLSYEAATAFSAILSVMLIAALLLISPKNHHQGRKL